MGFFSDLKEDLSHAVNELMPEETGEKADLPQDAGQMDKKPEPQKPQEAQEAGNAGDSSAAVNGMPERVQTAGAGREGADSTMQNQTDTNMADVAVITAGMRITGDIESDGALEMRGSVEGSIQIGGKLNVSGSVAGDMKAAEIYADGAKVHGEVISTGAVKVGRDAVIIGNVTGTSAVIAGAVKGGIDVRGPVILDSTAIVMGDIKSKSVQINNGAVIEGMCSQCYAEVSPSSFFRDYEPAQEPLEAEASVETVPEEAAGARQPAQDKEPEEVSGPETLTAGDLSEAASEGLLEEVL